MPSPTSPATAAGAPTAKRSNPEHPVAELLGSRRPGCPWRRSRRSPANQAGSLLGLARDCLDRRSLFQRPTAGHSRILSRHGRCAMGEFVRVEIDQAIATIRLDRPPMNALNAQVQDEIGAAAAQVDTDPAVRAVVLYGGEKVFAAGADIKEMAEASFARIAVDSRRLQA